MDGRTKEWLIYISSKLVALMLNKKLKHLFCFRFGYGCGMDNVVGDGNSGGGGYGGMPHASVPTTGHPSVRPVC